MKQVYEAPALEIEWFETAEDAVLCNSQTDYIPDVQQKDTFGW